MRVQRTTPNQFENMVNFLEQNPNMLRRNFSSETAKQKYQIAWEVLTSILNSDPLGPKKSVAKWKKTLQDWKQHLKAKHIRILESQKQGCVKEKFSPLEEKYLGLIGYDILEVKEEDLLSSVNISVSSSSSPKRKHENEEESDSELSSISNKDDVKKNYYEYRSVQNKKKRERLSSESETPEIEDSSRILIESRMIEIEEQKADSLQRIATSFESIASSFGILCNFVLQQTEKQSSSEN